MNQPDSPLPVVPIVYYLPQLQAILDAIGPTDSVQALVESDDAQRYPQLRQYVCGTEHLGLTIRYLERAIGVSNVERNESLDYDPEFDYGQGTRDVDVQRESPDV